MSDFPYKIGKPYIFWIGPKGDPTVGKVVILDVTKETVLFESKDAGTKKRILRSYFMEHFKLIEEIE